MSRSQVESGKRWEREVARLLGVRRVIRDSYGETAPDVVTGRLIIEAKYRKSLSIETWMQQVERHAEPGKICAVFAREHNGKPIAVCRLEDFLELISEGDE